MRASSEYAFVISSPYRGRMPRFSHRQLGVILALASGVAFAVQPVVGQLALDGGASIASLLGWRYALAAIVLGLLARKGLARMPLRTALLAFALGLGLYAADCGALLRVARAHVGPLRDAPPLRAPRGRRGCSSAARAGAARCAPRRRPRRRAPRGGSRERWRNAGRARDRARPGLGGGVRRVHPRLGSPPRTTSTRWRSGRS